MSYGEGHNVFNDIPGFDASKGERISKALQRLWAKIEHLEQIRISEKMSRSKAVQTSSSSEDLTITDVQYKLLVLQLQYVRSLLRKKLSQDNSVIHKEKAANNQNPLEKNKENNFEYHNFEHFKSDAVCQGTQTGGSLIEGMELEVNTDSQRNHFRAGAQVSADRQVFECGDSRKHAQSASTSHKMLPSNSRLSSRPHYHFKLDDVPFILGASSTASHSVVANVQNIIAMMKTHNKALCGPKHPVQRVSSVNTQSCRGDTEDASKMLNELSQDLYELGQRQANLIKRVDAAQGKDSHFSKVLDIQDKAKASKASEGSLKVYEEPRRARSNSESTKLQVEVNVSKQRERDVSKYNVQPRQILSSTRNQSSNLPIIARRNLLRSLQNFKTHLSEEDISWE